MKTKQIFVVVAVLIATSFIALYIYDFLNNADNIVNVTSNNNVVINNNNPISARTVSDLTSNMSNTTNSTVQQINENVNTIPGWGYALAFGGFAVVILCGIAAQMYGLPTIPVTENAEAVEMASDIVFRHTS